MKSLALLIGLIGVSGFAVAQQQAADNTGQNKGPGLTADKQKNDKTDRLLAQKIRKALTTDAALSSYAHNVKIIAAHGTVTLRGPVRSAEEKTTIEAKANEIAGKDNVTSELTIADK